MKKAGVPLATTPASFEASRSGRDQWMLTVCNSFSFALARMLPRSSETASGVPSAENSAQSLSPGRMAWAVGKRARDIVGRHLAQIG
jgi:hypothetical protein